MFDENKIKDFDAKLSEYQNLQKQITNELRDLLINVNNNKDTYALWGNSVIRLREADIKQMQDIMSDVKQKIKRVKNENLSSLYRENMLSKNKYKQDDED